MRDTWRAWALGAALGLAVAACAGGANMASPAASQAEPALAPVSLAVEPRLWSTAPLPTAEAARVFVWPANGKPSLIFVYDDAVT